MLPTNQLHLIAVPIQPAACLTAFSRQRLLNQFCVADGGKQIGNSTFKLTVLKKKIHDLEYKIGDPFFTQIVGAEFLGDFPFHAVHLHFQFFLFNITPGDAECGIVSEPVILTQNHDGIRHAHDSR